MNLMVYTYLPAPHQQIVKIDTEVFDRGIPIARYIGPYKSKVNGYLQLVQSVAHHTKIQIERKKRTISIFPELSFPPTDYLSLGLLISLWNPPIPDSTALFLGTLDSEGSILPISLSSAELTYLESRFSKLIGNISSSKVLENYYHCSHISELPKLRNQFKRAISRPPKKEFSQELTTLFQMSPRITELLAIVSAENLHILLFGPIGIGKTTVVRVVQELHKHPTPKLISLTQQTPTSATTQLTINQQDPYILELSELPLFSKNKLSSILQILDPHTKPPNLLTCVATMNICPCGKFPTSSCSCSPHKRAQYISRLHGNLLDRFDLKIQFPADPSLFEFQPISSNQISELQKTLHLSRTYPNPPPPENPEEIQALLFRLQRTNPSIRTMNRAKRVFRAIKWFKRDLSIQEQIKLCINLVNSSVKN